MDPRVIAVFIPVLALLIPIIAILVNHQQRMAQIYANNATHHHDPEVAELRREIQELKQLIHQQAIAMDTYSTRASTPPPAPTISDRLNVGGY